MLYYFLQSNPFGTHLLTAADKKGERYYESKWCSRRVIRSRLSQSTSHDPPFFKASWGIRSWNPESSLVTIQAHPPNPTTLLTYSSIRPPGFNPIHPSEPLPPTQIQRPHRPPFLPLPLGPTPSFLTLPLSPSQSRIKLPSQPPPLPSLAPGFFIPQGKVGYEPFVVRVRGGVLSEEVGVGALEGGVVGFELGETGG